MFSLRYYQERLLASARRAWESHQSTAIISCTGSGKTEMYLSLAVGTPGRVLVIAHRDYLLSQPIERLRRVGYDDVAVEKANQRSEVGFAAARGKIVFASVQSLQQERRLAAFNPLAFSLVIVDEGHRATAPTYRKILAHFTAGNPLCKVLVVTATPNRKDGVALGNVCESVAGTYGPSQAMADGWIVPVKFFRRDVQSLDFSHIRMKGTDLDPDQVQKALMEEKPLHEVCASLAEDRGPTIVFCPEVAVANAYAQLMHARYRPNKAVMICGESTEDEREDAKKKLADGDIDYIFQVNLMTEGFDLPSLLRVVWAAPTASLVKYTQGVGRVFRPHDSLRGQLAGGQADAPHRRRLIADSPKPFGVVVTYYPQNCKHELCDPVDILGGEDLPADVKRYAKQVQDEQARGGGSDAEQDIETAKLVANLRDVLDQRRKQIRAEAQVRDTEFDPMSGHKAAAAVGGTTTADQRATARAVVGTWGAGEPATDKQVGWFQWKRIATPEGLTKFQASVVRDLVELGVKPDTAFGYTRPQALKVRAEMQARRQGREGAA